MRIKACIAVLASITAACGAAFAGPADNARQFQEKAVKSAVRGVPGSASKSRSPIIDMNSGAAIIKPADTRKADTKQAVKDKTGEAEGAKIVEPAADDK